MSDKDFYALTPRQFHLLAERHREDLVHREMVAAFTTAAVKNFSHFRPETPASPLDFMLNHKAHKTAPMRAESTLEEEEFEQVMSDYNLKVTIMAAKLKAQKAVEQSDGQ